MNFSPGRVGNSYLTIFLNVFYQFFAPVDLFFWGGGKELDLKRSFFDRSALRRRCNHIFSDGCSVDGEFSGQILTVLLLRHHKRMGKGLGKEEIAGHIVERNPECQLVHSGHQVQFVIRDVHNQIREGCLRIQRNEINAG